MAQQFLPSCRRVRGRGLDLDTEDAAVFLRKTCEDRLLFLRNTLLRCVYGKGYVRRILDLALSPRVVSRWNAVRPHGTLR